MYDDGEIKKLLHDHFDNVNVFFLFIFFYKVSNEYINIFLFDTTNAKEIIKKNFNGFEITAQKIYVYIVHVCI